MGEPHLGTAGRVTGVLSARSLTARWPTGHVFGTCMYGVERVYVTSEKYKSVMDTFHV